SAAAAGHDHPVDVHEFGIALGEPGEIAAVVAATRAEADQEAGQAAVALGHAEIVGVVVEPAQARGVEREDRWAGGVVQCEDGIQLVLAHVADDNRHSRLRGMASGANAPWQAGPARGSRWDGDDYRMASRRRGMTSGPSPG